MTRCHKQSTFRLNSLGQQQNLCSQGRACAVLALALVAAAVGPAGENRYMGSSVGEAHSVLKVPEPCGPPFPVLAQSQHVLPRAWRRQNSGGSRGVLEGMGEHKGSFPAPLRMFKPQSISVLHLCSQWLFLGRIQGNPCLASLLFHLVSVLSLPRVGWEEAPQGLATFYFLFQWRCLLHVCLCPIG